MITQHSAISFIRKYASIFVLLFCLLALYVFLSIGFRSVLGPVIGGTFGGLAAVIVIFLLGDTREAEYHPLSPPDYRIPIIVSSLYASSIIIMYQFFLYERPWLHYVVFGAVAGYIAFEIATGARRVRVVPQILTLAFFTYWSIQFAFPAGMYGPDTKGRALPTIRTALREGVIPIKHISYFGEFSFVTEFSLITGLEAEISYYLLSVLVLTGTLLLISIIDISLPGISERVALYGALIFGCMSWTVGRGMHPNKLNFFYPLLLLVGLAALGIYSANNSATRDRWLAIGILVSPALIFGHRFSAGATMVFVSTIGLFVLLANTVLNGEYTLRQGGLTLGFVTAYILGVIGNPIHTGPLLGRISSLILSLLAPSGGTGGPGRYSTFSFELLFINTAGQAILFGLGVFGAALVIRRSDWEYDFVICWMGVLAALLIVSLVFNAADVQPQRFYSLLGLFGLNICAGVALHYVQKINRRKASPAIIASIICVFVVLSFASPIADMTTSPFDDEIPHFKKFETNQLNQGNEWLNKYTQNSLRVIPPSSDIQIKRVDGYRGKIDVRSIPPGTVYAYSRLANSTGIVVDGGLSIGGRNFVFVPPPSDTLDSTIYENGETRVSIHTFPNQSR